MNNKICMESILFTLHLLFHVCFTHASEAMQYSLDPHHCHQPQTIPVQCQHINNLLNFAVINIHTWNCLCSVMHLGNCCSSVVRAMIGSFSKCRKTKTKVIINYYFITFANPNRHNDKQDNEPTRTQSINPHNQHQGQEKAFKQVIDSLPDTLLVHHAKMTQWVRRMSAS